jgi:hypothetical protein
LSAHDTSRAVAAGLTSRPLARTLADTLAWTLGQPASAPQGAGLTDAEERTLLMAIDGSPVRTAPTS